MKKNLRHFIVKVVISCQSVLIACCLIYFGSTACLISSNGIVGYGFLKVTSFDGIGEKVSMFSSTNQFRVSIDLSGRYALEIHPVQEPGDTIYLTYDGIDTFFVRYREAIVDANQNIIGTKLIDDNVHPGYISSGNYPYAPWDEQKRAHILWLVFGAGKYLHDYPTNTIPLPWIAARWSLMSYGFRVDRKLSGNPPFIIENAQFVRDGRLDLSSDELEMDRPELDSPTSDHWIEKWKKEMTDKRQYWVPNFIAGQLDSDSFTNINGLTIPMQFSFKAFHPRWTKRTNKLRWQYEGLLTNIVDLPDGEMFHPPIMSVVGVQDSRYRFRDASKTIGNINYAVTKTNGWRPYDSVENNRQLQAGIASREVSARLTYGSLRTKRLVVFSCFFLCSLFLPLFLYLKARQRNNIAKILSNDKTIL